MWAGTLSGPRAVPGPYQARLVVDDDSMSVPFEILRDPRLASSVADLQARHDFVKEANETLSETHRAIKRIRNVRQQVEDVSERAKAQEGIEPLNEAGDALLARIKEIEEALYQTKNQSRQDPLNFPIRLNNKLAAVKGTVQGGEFRPTDQQMVVKEELTTQIEAELDKLQEIMENDLPAFNKLVRDLNLPAVFIDTTPDPAM
jgi:predicted ribosome quality control (RQC) complex YloA/Tae2 family protein